MTDKPEFSRIIDSNTLGNVDFTFETRARPEERAALAKRLGLLDLGELSVHAVISPKRKGEIRVRGTFGATLRQACVITLKPVESNIETAFERIYADDAETWFGDEDEPDEEGRGLSPAPPESMIDGCFDLGEAVAEQLSLEIDTFPRRPGVEFDGGGDDAEDDDGRDSPFAVLGKLKNKP